MKAIQKIFGIFATALMLLSIALAGFAENNLTSTDLKSETNTTETTINTTETTAQEDVASALVDDSNITVNLENETQINEDAGIAPDSPIAYGLERAMESIDLAFTFNKETKARKELAHARERLAEVQKMVLEKKLDKAEVAQKLRDEKIERIKARLDKSESKNSTYELEIEYELEADIEKQKEKYQTLIKFKGNLTDEQKQKILEIINASENANLKFQEKLQEKRMKTKIKMRAEGNISEDELNSIEDKIIKKNNITMKKELQEKLNEERREFKEKIKEMHIQGNLTKDDVKKLREDAKSQIDKIKEDAKQQREQMKENRSFEKDEKAIKLEDRNISIKEAATASIESTQKFLNLATEKSAQLKSEGRNMTEYEKVIDKSLEDLAKARSLFEEGKYFEARNKAQDSKQALLKGTGKLLNNEVEKENRELKNETRGKKSDSERDLSEDKDDDEREKD